MKCWSVNPENLTFGFEIECNMPQSLVTDYEIRIGDRLRPVRHRGGAIDGFGCQSDQSIPARTGYRGGEWIAPVLRGEAGMRRALRFVEWLQRHGADPRGCGFHVHVGLASILGDDATHPEHREEYLRRLTNLVGQYELALYASSGTVARERGEYCRSLRRHEDLDLTAVELRRALKGAATLERPHSSLNPNALARYHVLNLTRVAADQIPVEQKTVEFRVWSGTCHPIKVLAYIQMALALCQKAATERNSACTWSGVIPYDKSYQGESGWVEMQRFLKLHGWSPTGKHLGWVVPYAEYGAQVRDELKRLCARYDQERVAGRAA